MFTCLQTKLTFEHTRRNPAGPGHTDPVSLFFSDWFEEPGGREESEGFFELRLVRENRVDPPAFPPPFAPPSVDLRQVHAVLPDGSAMQNALANFYYVTPGMLVYPVRDWRSVEKMNAGEFAEIHEAWTEVMAAFEEAEVPFEEEQVGAGAFAAGAAPVATAR